MALFREHEGVNTFLRKKNRATETLRLKVPTNLEFWIPFLAVLGIMQAFQLKGVQFLWASAMAEASYPYNIADHRLQLREELRAMTGVMMFSFY